MPLTTRRSTATPKDEPVNSFLPTALRTRLEIEKKEAAERAAAASGYVATPKDGESVELRVMSELRWGTEIWYDYTDDEGNEKRGCTRWDSEDLLAAGLKEPPEEEIPEGHATRKDGSPHLKTFFAVVVWNYKEERFQIWAFTQLTLREQFCKAVENKRYGDPRDYDFEWSRTGKTVMDTKHTLMPMPPSELDSKIAHDYESFNCDLKAYCQGAAGEVVFPKGDS